MGKVGEFVDGHKNLIAAVTLVAAVGGCAAKTEGQPLSVPAAPAVEISTTPTTTSQAPETTTSTSVETSTETPTSTGITSRTPARELSVGRTVCPGMFVRKDPERPGHGKVTISPIVEMPSDPKGMPIPMEVVLSEGGKSVFSTGTAPKPKQYAWFDERANDTRGGAPLGCKEIPTRVGHIVSAKTGIVELAVLPTTVEENTVADIATSGKAEVSEVLNVVLPYDSQVELQTHISGIQNNR